MQSKSATLKHDLLIIFILGGLLTFIAASLDLDPYFASSLHGKHHELGWFLRQYSQFPMIVISVIFLIFILIPPLRRKYNLFNHTALVWLFTLLFGAGLLVHTFLKEGVDRPRPRETEILGGNAPYSSPFQVQNAAAEFKGKSFPSGHVAMAAMLAVPFFTLRRKKPKIAKAFLISGIAYAFLVGYGRMVLGAHFLTDVLWGVLCVLFVASVGASVIHEKAILKSRYTFALIIFAIFCLAWFNKFSLTLNVTSNSKHIEFLPACSQITIKNAKAGQPYKAKITVFGYGGPTSWLTGTSENGVINYTTSYGLFRNLDCKAVIYKPKDVSQNFPNKSIPKGY